MRQQWMLLALACVVAGPVVAEESSARAPGVTANARPSVRGLDFDVYADLKHERKF